MERSDLNLTRFLYNPFEQDTIGKLVAKYDEFGFKFINFENKKKIVSYIILMFDFNTPLREDILDYNERKRTAALLAGFKVGDGGYFKKEIEDALIGQNDDVNRAIIRYTMLFSNPDYMMLVSFYDMFFRENEEAFKSGATKTKIENIDKLNKAIKKLTKEIFGGEESVNLRKALYGSADEMRVALKPEDVATRLEKGKRATDTAPYGEKYDFNKYTDETI